MIKIAPKNLNISAILVIAVFLLSATQALAGGVSHTSYGYVTGGGTSNSYKFYVVNRPGEVLTGNLSGSGPYLFMPNAGNLTTSWSIGEDSVAVVWKEDNPNNINHAGYYAVMNESLFDGSPQQYADSTLRAIPVPTASIAGEQINLSWSAAVQDQYENPATQTGNSGNTPGANIIGYNVYRSTDGYTYNTKINDALVTGTTYSDNAANSTPDPVSGISYYYSIELVYKAQMVAGNGTPILSANASNSPVAYPAADPKPTITRAPASFDLIVTQGQNVPGTAFNVGNSGTATLNYSMTDDKDWLAETPNSGSIVKNGNDQEINLNFDTDELSVGQYNATITIIDPAATNNPQTIPVTLTVNPIPLPTITRTWDLAAFNLSVVHGQNVPSTTFNVGNSGSATLNYTVNDDQTWLSETPANGSIAQSGVDQVINVNFNTAGLEVGGYNATITISDPTATNNPQTILVSLNVTTPPQPTAEVIPAKLTVEAGEQIVITLKYSESNQVQHNWVAPTKTGACDLTPYFSDVILHGATSVNVVPAALDHVVITPAIVTLEQGAQQTFTAKGYDSYDNERSDTFDFASELGNSSTVIANVPADEYLLSAYKDGKSTVATITVTPKYQEMIAKVVNGQVEMAGKDALGNVGPLASGAVVTYDVTGQADGNQVLADGTFVPGTKDGAYTITATIKVGSKTFTADTTVSVNLGGPELQIKIDDQALSNDLAINSRPKIEVTANDGNGIKAVRIYIDGKEVGAAAMQALGSNGTTSYSPSVDLSGGAHTLQIEAEDSLGSTRTVTAQGLKVYNTLEMTGKPMNYPNPFKPSSGVGTTINYKMTQNAVVKLMIYDLTGRMVYTQSFAAGENGGRLENDVTWDGKNFKSEYVGNGVYAYFLTVNGKALGSGEMAVYE